MDQEILVNSGIELVRLLDETPAQPDMAMWVHDRENDSWKLRIAPHAMEDKREFYRIVADQLRRNSDRLGGLDIASTEYVSPNSPMLSALRRLLHMPEAGKKYLGGNLVDGFYVPEGIAVLVR